MEANSIQQSRITTVADSAAMADTAIRYLINCAQQAIKQRGVFRVAISGGSTPVRFYERLSDASVHSKIQWEKVHIFWVDERCVPPSSEASNFGLATDTFLLDIPIPGENIHRVTGELQNYADAVDEYEQIIRSVFKIAKGQVPEFDLVILGMGSDGHIGSILPNTYALFDTDDLVSAVYRMNGDYNRITLTIPVMKEARRIVILVSGDNKAQIMSDVFRTEPDPVRYPVHALWPVLHKVRWLIDRPAAAKL
ncbi:MAG: 6-phosphogluconolactonase [Planctomycetales bacterium 4572_13]|nr:MAG: 6-phosphogluconolactonase [Planctomycetales bacterium 4572_13]